MTEAPVPLARLFAMAFRDLIDDLHARLSDRGWHDLRPAFGFALVAARDGPTDATALAGLLGVTKQAASKLVDSLVAAGLVERSVGAADARRRPVAITDRGGGCWPRPRRSTPSWRPSGPASSAATTSKASGPRSPPC